VKDTLPPQARVEIVRQTYYGTTIEDPYRWMEDWQGEELQAWLKAQAAYAREYLDALPEHDALLARVSELSDTTPSLSSPRMVAGRTFYLRRDPGENLPKLVVRDGPDAPERVLVDPATIEGEAHTNIDWYFPSPDGRLVAYGLSQGGSEDSTLFVREVDSGKMLGESISRTRFNAPWGGVRWLEDNRSFLYHRLVEHPPDAPLTERYFDSRSHLHRLGTDPDSDPVILGRGVHPGVEIARQDFPSVFVTSHSDWMIGVVIHGVLNERTLYAAPRAALSDPAAIPWRMIVDVEDGVAAAALIGGAFALRGDTVYLRTHKDAPRFQVVAMDLRHPDRRTVVVPEGRAVIESVQLAKDYLLIRDLDGGIGRLRRVKLADGEVEEVPLAFDGTIMELNAADDRAEALIQLTSPIVSPRFYHYDAETGMLQDTGWIPPAPIDFSEIEMYRTQAPSRDGTLIPLTIIHKKELKRDGANPAIVWAYGSYGISIPLTFVPSMLAWWERGGILVIAHARGGGEYGTEWHEAGRKLNKQNTVDDFIAAAEWLISQGYTRPERLAGQGGSAGGIPTGNALVQRPDLWAAMVMQVAVTNFLRFEFSENGPPNVPEFGSVSTEDGFRGLQIMDSYTKVKDGTVYPAVLITTGLNDPRVVVWQATKMAARLQAATASGRPVPLRAEQHGGHGIGSSKRQRDEETADILAFLLEQFH
jgi:prolyl oligopeptidase